MQSIYPPVGQNVPAGENPALAFVSHFPFLHSP